MKGKLIGLLLTILTVTVHAQTWSTVGAGATNSVSTFAIYNGKLIAGGGFINMNGLTVNYIAKWDTAWSFLGSGMNANVNAMVVYNGDLYAAGGFTKAGGNNANYIAKWDGSSWSALGTGLNGPVFSLAVHNNELCVGGSFNNAGGVPANFIARWNGTQWDSLGRGMYDTIYFNRSVFALASYKGELYAGGNFRYAGGKYIPFLAKWDGSSWSSVGTGASNGDVYSFGLDAGMLYVGGPGQVGGVTVNGIGRWDGANWFPLGLGLDTGPDEITAYNGELYVGGWLTLAGGITCNRIAKWNGTTWSSLGTGMTGSYVDAMAVYKSELFVGGKFTKAGGISALNIAKWSMLTTSIRPGPLASEQMNVYPNPFSEQAMVSFDEALENATLKLFDVLGKEVRSVTFSGDHVVVSRQGLSPGIFILCVSTVNGIVITKKIVVE